MGRESEQMAQEVRNVVLPNGRTVDIVCFTDEPAKTTPAGPRELHVCPECSEDMVQPVGWDRRGHECWHVGLWCANCDWEDSGEFEQDALDRFDEALDEGTEALVGDLKALQRANMEEEIELFAAALACDALLPEDF